MKDLIKKLLRENTNQLKFNKIEVELFNFSSSVTHDYENGARGGGSYSTPKDKRVKLRITPIIDLSHYYDRDKNKSVMKHGEEYDKFFDYDEGIDLSGLLRFGDGNTIVLCQEGILTYESDDDSDCDVTSYSFRGNFIPHSKISEWGKIKEFIKPRLKQSDIDDAIRTIGKQKEFCKVTNYTGTGLSPCNILNNLKKQNKIESYESLDFYGSNYNCSGLIIIKINGKYGAGYVRNNNIKTIIPYIYEKYSLDATNKVIKMRKNGIIYNYKNYGNGVWKISEKNSVDNEKILKFIDTVKQEYEELEDRYKQKFTFDEFFKHEYGIIYGRIKNDINL